IITPVTAWAAFRYLYFYELGHTPAPVPTAVPVATSAPPPTSGRRLGGIELHAFCRSLGLSGGVSAVGSTWLCAPEGKHPRLLSPDDLSAACRLQYGAGARAEN